MPPPSTAKKAAPATDPTVLSSSATGREAKSGAASTTSTSLPTGQNQIKNRQPHSLRGDQLEDRPAMNIANEEQQHLEQQQQQQQQQQQPLLRNDESVTTAEPNNSPSSNMPPSTTWTRRNEWILFALASGACAAFNGVFAKLTTTELTSSFSQGVARLFHLSEFEGAIEVVLRGIFFALNLIFNGVMWTLFTTALARGNSTTQVAIMNTSSNFFITAVLGFAIFSEALPPLWWLGASMLVAGNVIIGRKDEGGGAKGEGERDDDAASVTSAISLAEDGLGDHDLHRHPDYDEDVPQLGEVFPPPEKEDSGDEDLLDLGAESTTR